MRLRSVSANTIGAVDNLVGDLLRQRLAAGQAYDHVGPLRRPQTIEIEHRHMRTANPGWRELWTKGDDHQHPQRTRSTNRSSNSRAAGSLPCASSNTTDCRVALPSPRAMPESGCLFELGDIRVERVDIDSAGVERGH
jgi:hypothetical protein